MQLVKELYSYSYIATSENYSHAHAKLERASYNHQKFCTSITMDIKYIAIAILKNCYTSYS